MMRVDVTEQQVRAAFEPVKDEPDFRESAALFDQGHMPAEMIQALCLRPKILQAFGRFGGCVYPGGLLEQRLKEFVIIEASRRNTCQFCFNSHIDVVKMLGMADEPIAAMDSGAELSPREQLALEYTRAAMTDSNRVPDDLFERLQHEFTDPEIVELTFLIGKINMLNIFNNCLQVAYHGEYDRIEAVEKRA